MIKNKLDIKLINILLIAVIVYLFYQTKTLWLNILNKIISIIIPLLISFTLAYAIYPIINILKKYKIPKFFGIFIVYSIILIILTIIVMQLVPIITSQLNILLNYIPLFIKNINLQNDFLIQIIDKLNISFDISKTINVSINFITNLGIVIILSVYFLIYMDKIRDYLKNNLNKKQYNYLKTIDIQMTNYISGFIKIVLLSFFEYTFSYYLIGHPNAILLGILSAISNFIPCFGNLIVQLISVVSGLVINETLGLKVIIITLILSLIDSYVINPLIYGKTNELSPILVIVSIFIFGILFGILGVIISLPLTIIIISTIKFYKENK